MFIAKRFSSTLPTESIKVGPQDLPILGKTLGELQDWAVKLNKGDWSKDGKAQLWIREDVYVSHQAIGLFLEQAQSSDTDVRWQAEGAAGGFVEEIAFGDETPMMVWLSEPAEYDANRLTNAEVLSIDVKTYPIQMPAPQAVVGADFISFPLTDAVVLPIGHWSQTLWGNLLALGPYLWRELVGDTPLKVVFRLGWAMVRSFSKDPRKLMRHFVEQGKGCKIHPSAVVEGCILGDYVTIGANAVVRGSLLRSGSKVEELAIVEGAILSERAIVQRQAMVKYSVLSDDSAVAGVSQLSVIGENASLKRGGYLMDMSFSGAVQVLYNGQPKPSPLGLIGCSVGENTTIGLGVSVAAGRSVPPDLKVVMNPNNMLRSVTLPDPEQPSSSNIVCVEKGKLRRVNVD